MPPGVKAPWEPTSGSSWDGVVSGEQPGATSGCGDLARAGLVSGSEAQTRIPDTRSAYENRTWTARRWRSRIRLGHRAGPLTPTTALGVGHHGGLYPKGGGARGLPPSPPAGEKAQDSYPLRRRGSGGWGQPSRDATPGVRGRRRLEREGGSSLSAGSGAVEGGCLRRRRGSMGWRRSGGGF
jgi:hypothetical protein